MNCLSSSKRLPTRLFSLLLMVSLPVYALDTQRDLPIDVVSNSAELNDQTGIAKYLGDVIITQGDSKLEAEEVAVTVIDQSIQLIEASGSPARFREGAINEEPRTQGSASTIRYDAEQATLLFQGQAELLQQGNTFAGEQIIYDIEQRAIRATGNDSGESRVKIRYRPADFKTEKPESPPIPQDENKGPQAPSNQDEAPNGPATATVTE